MESRRTIQVGDKIPIEPLVPSGIQYMFAVSGVFILVPFLLGTSPAVALSMDDMGALLLISVTKEKVSIYLESSPTFLAPVGVIISSFGRSGYAYALGGFVVMGLCGYILAFIVYKFSTKWIDVVLPPAATGPIVVLIRLELSGNAVQSAGFLDKVMDPKKIIVFIITSGTTVSGSTSFRKFFSVIPILVVVIAGCVVAFTCRFLDFTAVAAAPVLAFPNFSRPKLNPDAIMTILPMLLVITSEHIGHQAVTSKIVGRDLLKDPGLHHSLLGNNFPTTTLGLIGSVPTTTYGENIGVIAITRAYNMRVIAGVATLSIIYSFVGRLSTPISTIPGSMIGGISFFLYGVIGTSGLWILVDSRVDYGNSRNLALTSITLVTGLSEIAVGIGNVQLAGMALACAMGVILSLVFYLLDYFRLINNQE